MSINNKIQSFAKKDLDEIVKIENQCHITPWTKKNFIDSFDAKNLFKVLKIENDIIGYYIALFASDECQLLNITVKFELQSEGFGSMLIKNLLNDCRRKNTANIFLEVRRSNYKAIRLYEKNGFNETGVRNNYYKKRDGREDAILMGLSI